MASLIGQLPVQSYAEKPRQLNWPAIAWFAALLIVTYLPALEHLVARWGRSCFCSVPPS
jgi:hypothetical protein